MSCSEVNSGHRHCLDGTPRVSDHPRLLLLWWQLPCGGSERHRVVDVLVVLAVFSAIFWLSRQLKWRNSQKMAPVPAGFDQANCGLRQPLPPPSVVMCW
jgi:hypothetical protein